MNTTSTRRLRLSVAGIGLLMGLLGSVVGAAYASHQFSDVPNSQPHHDNINALVDSGCATGFDDGTFRPGDPVTRGQTARQIVQCGTRIVRDENTAISNPADGVTNVVGEAALTAGGSNPNTGYVLVIGTAGMAGDETADCPCRLTVEVRNVNTNDIQGITTNVIGPDEDCVLGLTCGTVTTMHVYPAGNTTAGNTFQARARLSTVGDNTGYTVDGNVIAMYIPFDGNPTD